MFVKVIRVLRYGAEYKVVEYSERFSARRSLSRADVEVSEGRFLNNISRARARVFELASCNSWDYFVTLTLNSEYDRTDLRLWRKQFSQWLRDYRKKGFDVRYLLIPEQHKNGAWHFHGFFSGVPASSFEEADIGGVDTDAAVRAYKAGELNSAGYMCWRDYSRRWGYCTLSAVKNPEACAKYVTKYVTKSMLGDALDSGEHLFYASQGLKGADVLAWNAIPIDDADFQARLSDARQFCNEYLRIWYVRDLEKIAPLVDYITGEKFELTDLGK